MPLRAADGTHLTGYHLRAHEPTPSGLAIVVAHGFTVSAAHPALGTVAAWLRQRAGVVLVDLRGHGRSGGASTVGDLEVLDLDAAVRWARRLGYARVATLGFSMGSAVAVRHAALQGGVDAVAAVSGPAHWYYQGTRRMRLLQAGYGTKAGRLVLRTGWRTRVDGRHWHPDRPQEWPPTPEQAAARVAPIPLLVVHGDADRYLPVEHAQRLYAAAREPKELWVVAGYGHAEAGAVALGRDVVDRIGRWLLSAAGEATR